MCPLLFLLFLIKILVRYRFSEELNRCKRAPTELSFTKSETRRQCTRGLRSQFWEFSNMPTMHVIVILHLYACERALSTYIASLVCMYSLPFIHNMQYRPFCLLDAPDMLSIDTHFDNASIAQNIFSNHPFPNLHQEVRSKQRSSQYEGLQHVLQEVRS